MIFTVKHKNEPVVRFELLENMGSPAVHIIWKTEKAQLLPQTYDDFIAGAKRFMTHKNKEQVRKRAALLLA